MPQPKIMLPEMVKLLTNFKVSYLSQFALYRPLVFCKHPLFHHANDIKENIYENIFFRKIYIFFNKLIFCIGAQGFPE